MSSIGPDLSTRSASILQENYPRVASELLRPLLNLFTSAREVCDGDVDKFLILLAIAMRTTEHPEFKALSHQGLLAGEPEVLPSLGTNIRSIAASVAIPKETARRKLADLVEAGWLVRQGWDFRMTAKCYAALEPVRLRLQSMALSYHDLLSELLGR